MAQNRKNKYPFKNYFLKEYLINGLKEFNNK